MLCSIRHITKFEHSVPVSESIMEIRQRPRTEGLQRCLHFSLQIVPRARLYEYTDYLGNTIHHFDVPGRHTELTVTGQATVETEEPPAPPFGLDASAWNELDSIRATGEHYELLAPSRFARPTAALLAFQREIGFTRWGDPLSLLRELNSKMYYGFTYMPDSTKVDSPVDHALALRAGVCQDFAHVMIALVRLVGIPCRYVSGYLCRKAGVEDHRSPDGASHAWIEAFLPGLGWVGFDPTNNRLAGERHIRVAIGRDYADVPPTRGVFKGAAESKLSVGVRIGHEQPPSMADPPFVTFERSTPMGDEEIALDDDRQQQQQQ
jgi:transglutaminase-like putative cysteine protease